MEEQLPLITEDRLERPARRDRRRAGATRGPRRQPAAWHIDAETRRIGLQGVANAKATLRAAREARASQQAA
jgi:hypothetical protein